MHRTSTGIAATVCSLVLCSAGAWAQKPGDGGAAGAGIVPLTTVRVASGLNRPVYATHAPGDFSRLFILEQRGVIKILDLDTGSVLATPFLNIDSLVAGPVDNFDERGLLGMAFHPDYQNNGFFYLNYTNNSSDTTIRRYTVTANPNVADPASGFTLLTINQPFTNHNGGWLDFGLSDGYLYIATGDGGWFCDPGQRAQDITNQFLGKMLRIDVDGNDGPGGTYGIPPTNPFVGVTGDDEIWAYGLRNPWRCCFDRATGDLYMADVGQNAREEIDYQSALSAGGENYGWDCREGTACANSVSSQCVGTANGCSCSDPTLVDPIHEYNHSLGLSITGGYVYRGCAIPSLAGTYFFADFATNRIWSFKVVGGQVTQFVTRTSELDPPGSQSIGSIASFGEDAAGEMYIVERGGTTTGEIFKIIPVTPLPDFNCDGVVGILDLLTLLANWGPCPPQGDCPQDLDGDGTVGVLDLLTLLSLWG